MKYRNNIYISQEMYRFLLKSGIRYEGFVIGVGYAYTKMEVRKADRLYNYRICREGIAYHEPKEIPVIDSSPGAKARSYNFTFEEIKSIIEELSVHELSFILNKNTSYYGNYVLLRDKPPLQIQQSESGDLFEISVENRLMNNTVSLGEIKIESLLPYFHQKAISENKTTPGGPIIFIQRIEESPNATVSYFMAYNNTGDEYISGYFLEPGGPSTAQSGQDKRIPAGIHSLEPYSSAKYPNNYRIYSDVVPKERLILIHTGNYHTNTAGCFLPGEDYVLRNGDYEIKGGTSRSKMNELKTLLSKGNATVIINEK